MARESTMRVRVDPQLCEGHGLCLQLAPEVFDLNDDETAVCVEYPHPEFFTDIKAAVAACPRQAITVADDAAPSNSGPKE